ncbi:MAG: DUF1501 domain-containing protein [Bacteroidota bacterium]
MKRRGFLKRAGAASMLPLVLNKTQVFAHALGSPFSQLASMADNNDRVLVLVQLNGGNDGLNTVIPLNQYSNLAKARRNLLIPERKVIKFDTYVGLHPAMQEMAEMYGEAKLGIVRGVGYPKPNFSHFRSADIWKTASPAEEVWNTGWMGRYLEKLLPNYPIGYPNPDYPHPPAITIGSVVSSTCQGELLNLGMAVRNPDKFSALALTGVDETPDSPYGYELSYLRDMIGQTNSYLESVKVASDMGSNVYNQYPRGNRLASQLQIVARLIAGGLQTKVYIVNMGGFDTHANQAEDGEPTEGRHASLLGKLSTAIHAFQEDLRLMQLQHRVVGMTFSEFGRRIASNDSMGTDHGAAAPMFFFGTRVRNRIFGTNPEIPGEVAPRDNLPMQYDFRSLYGSVLMDWFGVEEEEIKSLLFPEFEYVPVIKGKNRAGGPIFERKVYMKQNYPNPFGNSTKIPIWLKEADTAQIRIFDGEGRLLETLMERDLPAGSHEITFNARDYSPGKYFFHVRVKHWHDMKVGIKT